MISPANQTISGGETAIYDVSCFDDSYVSDDDLSVEHSAQTSKRQKMTEVERLTRCRERNRVHARNTRERKKSQMDGLQSRIQELVDEKKRLNSSVSESSVASILMSLAGFEAPNSGSLQPNKLIDGDVRGYNALLPFKVDDDEDDISLSIEKLKMQVSALLGDDDCKDITDTDPILSKDKATCSTSELEMIRRERNRMHAKKTRLRKKKMIQEMETIIASLEKEVADLQRGLISILPRPDIPVPATRPNTQMITPADESVFNQNTGRLLSDPNVANRPLTVQVEMDFEGTGSGTKSRIICEETPSSSSSKKRKMLPSASITDGRSKHSSHHPHEMSGPYESDGVIHAQEDRGSQQYLWRQHISKNSTKTVSICSETASGSSEGSASEGDLSSGSAVHSLLHMSRTNSSDSRGSGSGSDESDAAPSKHENAVSNQIGSSSHSRNQSHHTRVIDKRTVTPAIHPTIGSASVAVTTPKTIQAILAACETKGPTIYAPPPSHESHAFEPPTCVQNHMHWRLPERVSSHTSAPLSMDIRIAASTVAAVASIYPLTTDIANDSTSYRGYVPMRAVEGPVATTFATASDIVKNLNFTVYGGTKQSSSSSVSSSATGDMKGRASIDSPYYSKSIPVELDTSESIAYETEKNSQSYSVLVPESKPHSYNMQSLHLKALNNSMDPQSYSNCNRDSVDMALELRHFTNGIKVAKQFSNMKSSRAHLAEGMLDCSSFKPCEIMPPSL